MPSFDITSDVDWQEIDNAINQAQKEIAARFDFKTVKVELKMDRKLKEVQIWCSEEAKLEAVMDVLQNKWIKRGISLLAFETKEAESAHGGSVRQKVLIKAGIEKDKGKEIIASLKDSKIKVQGQILDEQVRVTGKNRDDLQTAIQYLKGQQDKIKLPMQFGNFRE
jgi:cyclic-di-GMP-binding protein